MQTYNITELVNSVLRKSKLPDKFDDLDESTKKRLRREAEADGTTPEAIYEVIKAQRAQDLASGDGNGFDPDAIAKAARAR